MNMTHYLHLFPIFVSGVFAMALIAERVINLYFRFTIDSRVFMGQLENFLSKNDVQSAVELCASNDKSLLAHIIKSGLLKATRDHEEIKMALEVAIVECAGRASQRIGYLAMIANVATLLGLLGTIAGLISSFQAVASADAATKQSLLASGISMSMNATALGLIVAIPTMIAFSILNGKANKLIDDLEKGAGYLLGLLRSRVYDNDSDDFSKISFEDVPQADKTNNVIRIKGAA